MVIRIYDILQKNYLLTRGEGGIIKTFVEHLLNNDMIVELDFENIDMVSPSWVSEVIGDIAYNNGKEFLKERIKIMNANEHVKYIMNFTVKQILSLKDNYEKGMDKI